jgi:P pilus assembly chaperone PapD
MGVGTSGTWRWKRDGATWYIASPSPGIGGLFLPHSRNVRLIYTLTPSGARSTARITVTNTRGEVLNVELQPFSVTVDDTGKRAFTPAPDDFLIFPPQASIAGDKSQLMQVRYVGSPAMDSGKVFVLRVKQTKSTEMVKQDAGAAMQSHLAVSPNFNTTAIV